MEINEIIKCLKLLRSSVVLTKDNQYFTKLADVKPSSFDWVIKETITALENIDK